MTVTVKISESDTYMSELLAKVEAGEDVILSRGEIPIAQLVLVNDKARRLAAIEAMRQIRARAKPVTREEILEWKAEGRR